MRSATSISNAAVGLKPAKRGRDRVLDFWRGVSVLMVLLQHVVYYRFAVFRTFAETDGSHRSALMTALHDADAWMVEAASLSGALGVKIFFVISGYIITKLLLEEEAVAGAISIQGFYIRRVFRILPAYLVYLVFVLVASFPGWLTLQRSELPYAAAFLCNTALSNCGWSIAHTWSLAIEEQFYIFWPLLLFFGNRRARGVLVMCAIVILMMLSITQHLIVHGFIDNALSFVCVFTGALYAIDRRFRLLVQHYGAIISLTMIGTSVACGAVLGYLPLASLISQEFTPFLILVSVTATYRVIWLFRTSLFAMIAKLGVASYSVYLWQQPFTDQSFRYPAHSPLRFTPLIVIAVASYFLVEKPFVKIGKRFMRRRSPGAKATTWVRGSR